jgi:CRP/FNR family cyclic AMP-dependent transcriptional regulator
LRLEDPSR